MPAVYVHAPLRTHLRSPLPLRLQLQLQRRHALPAGRKVVLAGCQLAFGLALRRLGLPLQLGQPLGLGC